MSHLWLGHSLAEVGGASGYPYPGCRDLLGTPFGSPTPLVAEKQKIKMSKMAATAAIVGILICCFSKTGTHFDDFGYGWVETYLYTHLPLAIA